MQYSVCEIHTCFYICEQFIFYQHVVVYKHSIINVFIVLLMNIWVVATFCYAAVNVAVCSGEQMHSLS